MNDARAAKNARIASVRPPRAEIKASAAASCANHSRCFGRNERLEVHDAQEISFEHLNVNCWSGDIYQRLIGKNRYTLGDSVDVTAKLEMAKMINEIIAHILRHLTILKPFQVGIGEAKVQDVVNDLLQPGDD